MIHSAENSTGLGNQNLSVIERPWWIDDKGNYHKAVVLEDEEREFPVKAGVSYSKDTAGWHFSSTIEWQTVCPPEDQIDAIEKTLREHVTTTCRYVTTRDEMTTPAEVSLTRPLTWERILETTHGQQTGIFAAQIRTPGAVFQLALFRPMMRLLDKSDQPEKDIEPYSKLLSGTGNIDMRTAVGFFTKVLSKPILNGE